MNLSSEEKLAGSVPDTDARNNLYSRNCHFLHDLSVGKVTTSAKS